MNYSVEQVHDVHLKAAKHFIVNLRDNSKASEYLESRGINLAWAIDNGVGYALPKWGSFVSTLSNEERRVAKACGLVAFSEKTERHFDLFRDRIMFPILNNDGFIVGMGGRDISGEDDTPKYINTKETDFFQKHDILYNLHRCQSLNEPNIVVVEGYMDVIAARHAGINNLTAVMGTAFTEHHASACIKRGIKSVTFCYDGDKAGVGAANRSLHSAGLLQSNGVDVSFVFLPDGLDPDDIINTHGSEHFNELIAKGCSPEAFIADHAISELPNVTSIDLSMQATSKALTTAQEAGFNVTDTWARMSALMSDKARLVCEGYVSSAFPDARNEKQAQESHANSDTFKRNISPT